MQCNHLLLLRESSAGLHGEHKPGEGAVRDADTLLVPAKALNHFALPCAMAVGALHSIIMWTHKQAGRSRGRPTAAGCSFVSTTHLLQTKVWVGTSAVADVTYYTMR